MTRFTSALVSVVVVCALASAVSAQDFSDVRVEATEVAAGLHLLTGRGGNIAVVSGRDGVLMVDDQYAPLEQKIRDAVAAIDAGPIRFIVNTHWHFDHTGGNEAFAGSGSIIVAHENVRRRMSAPQVLELFDMKVDASPRGALPVLTFTRDTAFHLNDMTLRVEHHPAAHTDGDAIVWFERAGETQAVHMGDIYFEGRYPFVDTSSGGSVDGVIRAVDAVIEAIDDDTPVIPGHGPLADRNRLVAYRAMLDTVRGRVAAAIADDQDEAQTIALTPSAEFDAAWGGASIKPDTFVRMIYRDLVAQRDRAD